MNIYKRQMQKLGLTISQYSKLLDMPYEIVKKYVNEEEIEYNMEIKKLFNKNMMEKHEEIEKDIDNSKIKSIEIKQDENELLDWYYKKYEKEDLWDMAHVNSTHAFIRKYQINLNGKDASLWYYQTVVNKQQKQLSKLGKKSFVDFVEQLYDIMINNNLVKYERKDNTLINTNVKFNNIDVTPRQRTINNLKKWYKKFDLKAFVNDNNLSIAKIADEIQIGKSTLFKMASPKDNYIPSNTLLSKLKNYVDNFNEDIKEMEMPAIVTFDATPNQNNVVNVATQNTINNELIESLQKENEMLKEQNAKLVTMLKTRLTDDEIQLIRLFSDII